MRAVSQFVSLLLFLSLSCGAPAADYDVRTESRVVAFGDVHGAYDDWVAMLRELGVVDGDLNWSGGDTHLISLGDLIDRGPGSRAVVQLMMKLDRQAEKAGGAVHMVLGNHERSLPLLRATRARRTGRRSTRSTAASTPAVMKRPPAAVLQTSTHRAFSPCARPTPARASWDDGCWSNLLLSRLTTRSICTAGSPAPWPVKPLLI
jgi:hypothetical protein